MKKLTFIAMALVAVATSCKKDTTSDAAISFAGDTGYTATDATLATGATFKIKWTATCTTTDMAFISITKDDQALSAWTKVEIPSASKSTYVAEATLTAPLNAGAYTFAVVIYDKDNNVLTSKSIVITVGAAVALTTYSSVGPIGAGGSSSYGSYIDLDNGQVYGYTAVTTNATTKASIDAVFDQSTLYNYGSGLTGSTGTTFGATSLDATAFATATGTTLTGLTAVSNTIAIIQGDVVYFETSSGNKGLILIKTLTAETSGGADDRTITIDIKIKK